MTESLPHKSRFVTVAEVALFVFAVASLTYAVVTAPAQGIDVAAFRNIGLSWISGIYRIYGPPPFAAVVFAPLAMLSLPQALILFLAVNLLATCACLVLVKMLFGSAWPVRAACYLTALLLSWAPYRVTLRVGQISLIVVALLLGSVFSWKKDKRILAGLLVGLSLCKYPLSLPFFLYFVWRKEWKIAAIALVVVAALTEIYSLRLGLSPLEVILDYSGVTGHRSLSNDVQFSGATEIGPLLFALTGSESWSDKLSIALAALGLVSMAVVFRREPQCEQAHLAVVAFFSLWFVYHRTYDSVMCIIPAAFLIDLLVRRKLRVFATICLSALGLLAVSIPGLLRERLHLEVGALSANPLGFLGLHLERILIFGLFWSLLILLWRVGTTDRIANEQSGALSHPSVCNA
jgi:glycosyl transferase family 87